MHALPAIVVVVIVVAFIISALVVGVVHVVAESVSVIAPAFNLADTLSGESCNVFRYVLYILNAVVELVLDAVLDTVVVVLDILRNVFDLSNLWNRLVLDRFTSSREAAYLAACPASCVLRGIVHAVLETIKLILSSVLVFFPVLLDFMALVHEQCTTSKTSCSTHGAVCHVVVLLLLRLLLLFVAAVLALRRTLVVAASVAAAVAASMARVLESAFAVLLVDEEPAVFAIVPDSAPWRWDLRCALAGAVALLLIILLLATITLLAISLLGTAVIALRLLAVVVAALVVTTLLTAATALALVGELVDQVAQQTHDCELCMVSCV